MVKIEKGIPIPTRREELPLGDMEVGDSFYTDEPMVRISKRVSMRSARGKFGEKKFSVRTVGEGCRVWRIK